jgi:release factor glutamine methyltransferase
MTDIPVSLRMTLRAAAQRLDTARVDAPVHTARILLAHALNRDKSWLLAHDDDILTAADAARFAELMMRVEAHEPLFYVLGEREFFGLMLHVDKRVLIPRPETEMLVELALSAWRKARPATNASCDFADIGTGSGAIALAIASQAVNARLIASDVSADALDVARANAVRHRVDRRITFVQGNLLTPVSGLPRVLTANLPYVTRLEIDGLPPEIQDHEPRVALDGGEDGLDLVRMLLGQIATRRAAMPNPPLCAAFFEIGATQGMAALTAARRTCPEATCEMLRDLGRRDRVLALRWEQR